MVFDFGEPLSFYVVEGRWADDREADEKDVCLRIGQGSESIVIFLTSRVPQSQAYWLAIDHDARRVVIESDGDY